MSEPVRSEVILKFYMPDNSSELEMAQNGHLYKRVLGDVLDKVRNSLRYDAPIHGLAVDTEVTLTDGDDFGQDEVNCRKKVLIAMRSLILAELEEKGLRLDE